MGREEEGGLLGVTGQPQTTVGEAGAGRTAGSGRLGGGGQGDGQKGRYSGMTLRRDGRDELLIIPEMGLPWVPWVTGTAAAFLPETTWAGPETPARLSSVVDASVATFLRLCIGLAESSETAVSMTPFKRGNEHFFSFSLVSVQELRKLLPEKGMLIQRTAPPGR